MRQKIIMAMTALGVMAFLAGCSSAESDDHSGHDHDHNPPHEHGAKAEAEADHGDEIILSPATAKRMGVVVATLQPGDFHEVIKVSGQLELPSDGQTTASATASGIVTLASGIQTGATVRGGATIATISSKGIAGGDTNQATAAALEAARRELDRLKPLHAEGLVSTKEYNAAVEAYRLAQANSSGRPSGGVATAPSSGVITDVLVSSGQYVEVGQPIATIARSSRLTLKALLPARFSEQLKRLTTANFRSFSSNEVYDLHSLNGRLLSTADAATQGGYIPVYFTLDKAEGMIPGESVEVYLAGTPRSEVLTIPDAAIVEQQGNYYAYVRVDDEGYEKRLLRLGASDGRRTEVISGLTPGDQVVVEGATVIRLAESSGAVPEGHSHNH